MTAYMIKPNTEFKDTWDVEQISDDDASLAADHHLVAYTDQSLERLFWELAKFIGENMPDWRESLRWCP